VSSELAVPELPESGRSEESVGFSDGKAGIDFESADVSGRVKPPERGNALFLCGESDQK
jgi:hypothetical protein